MKSNLVETKSIPVFSKKQVILIDDFLKFVKKDSSVILFAQEIVEKILSEKIVHIVFAARQGSPFEALISGCLASMKMCGPTIDHIAVSSTGYTSDGGVSSVSELKKILNAGVRGKKLFVDHTSQSGTTETTLLACAKDLDPNSVYEFIHNYRYAPWDTQIGRYPGPYMSPHKFAGVDQVENWIKQNPSAPQIVENINEISIYQRLCGVLWMWAYEESSNSVEE